MLIRYEALKWRVFIEGYLHALDIYLKVREANKLANGTIFGDHLIILLLSASI
jgi:hypothetical protein